jgi:hypothetical protein
METSTIIRFQCSDKENWLKLIKKSTLNAIDLCLDLYTENEIIELNKILKHSHRFMIAYATPIISTALLLMGRALALFKEVYSIRLELTLNSKTTSMIKSFISTCNSNVEEISKLLNSIVKTLDKNIAIDTVIKQHKENSATVSVRGVSYSNKRKIYVFEANLTTEEGNAYIFIDTLVDLMKHYTGIFAGFLTPLDLGKVEGLYATVIAKMIEKSMLKIRGVNWSSTNE